MPNYYHKNYSAHACRLVEVLHDLGRGDWLLASLVCKTLWNYRYVFSQTWHNRVLCVRGGRGITTVMNLDFFFPLFFSFLFSMMEIERKLLCVSFFSCSEKLSSSVDCFGQQESLQLTNILTSYSGQPTLLLVSRRPYIEGMSVDYCQVFMNPAEVRHKPKIQLL